MSERKIIHIDMDAFYASIEIRDNPLYEGKPLAVGNSGGRGVISAASYEARKFGIRSAMPSVTAKRLCPDLIFVPVRMDYYKAVSYSIKDIFNQYTDLIEPISLDEAFLDVTENKKTIKLASEIALEIKNKIKTELGLTASAGVSYNKFLAKIASDYKKPDGLYVIHPDNAIDFIAKLPIEVFWGIGHVTAEKLHGYGIFNGSDLKKAGSEFLQSKFGKAGLMYHDFANGVDLRPVIAERERKSVGCEHTFEKDLTTQASITIELYHVVTELVLRLGNSGFKGHTLTLKIKFNDFTQKTRSVSVNKSFVTMQDILPVAKKLLKSLELIEPKVRLIGVSISNPFQGEDVSFKNQLSLDLD